MKPLPLPVRLAAGLAVVAIDRAKHLPEKLAELPVTVVSQALQLSMRVQQQVTELAIKGDDALASLRPVEETPAWATFDEDATDESGYGPDLPAQRTSTRSRFDRVQVVDLAERRGAADESLGQDWGEPTDVDASEPRTNGSLDGAEQTGAHATATELGTGSTLDGDADADAADQERASTSQAEGDTEPGTDSADASTVGGGEGRATATDEDTTTGGSHATGHGTPTDESSAADEDAGRATDEGAGPAGPVVLPSYPELSLPQVRARLRKLSIPQLQELVDYERRHENRPEFVGMLTRRISTLRAQR